MTALSEAPVSGAMEAGLARYRALLRRRAILLATLAAVVVIAFFLDVATGPSPLGPMDTVKVLFGAGPAGGQADFIVWQLRLPQAVLAVLVGGALGVAGVEMQTALDNPLADPFTLGVSSAAALGAALAIVLGISLPGLPETWVVAGNAFVFASASLLVLLLALRAGAARPETLILFGIAMSFTFGALLALLQFVASPDALQQLTFWSLGSLVRANWEANAIVGLALALALPFAAAACWRMTALRLGEESARGYGVDVAALRRGALLRISLLAAISVSFAGIIGFIGLTGPHIARLLIGEDHRFLLPASALTAMAVMSLAAVASKLVLPGIVVPIGIVTTLIGLPVFFSLIVARRAG